MAKQQAEIDYSKPLDNKRHERFSQEYHVCLNATHSYKVAYPKSSTRTAESNGSSLLRNTKVAGRIAYLQFLLSDICRITAKKVITELAKIGFANIKSFLDEGNEIKDISQLPDEIAAAVESIQSDIRHDSGDSEGYTEKVKIKFHSKLTALDGLAKHLGIYGKNNEQIANALTSVLDALDGRTRGLPT